MDDDWLTGGMRTLVTRSALEAVRRGSTTVEAEHVLLALTGDPGRAPSKLLLEAGLHHEALVGALRRERLRSLGSAGVDRIDAQELGATPRTRKPTWGASIAAARARAGRAPVVPRKRRPAEIGLLIGILQAELGTVPRALFIAGVDRPALVSRLESL